MKSVSRSSHLLFWQKLSLLALIVLCGSLHAANWPAWNGPRGSGWCPETNLPTQWSATENIRWKTALPDRGNSTPIVWGDRLFITQPVEKENRLQVMCFDRANGKLFWQQGPVYAGKDPTHRTNPYGSASPVTDGERVIAWFGSAGVYAYDFKGKELWHRDLGPQQHTWGYGASPVLYRDLCIVHFGPGERSFLIALNKNTGKTEWQVDLPQEQPAERTDGFAGQRNGEIGSWSTPLLVRANNRDELVLSLPGQVRAFDPGSGKELWRCDGLNPLIYTSAIYGEGVVVAMGGFHGTTIAVKAGGNGDVTKSHRLWQTPRTANRLGSGVIHDGHVYIVNTPGVAECIELKTGKVVWEERLRGPGPKNEFWSSMVLSGDRIYTVNQSGDTIILRASPKFEVIATNSIGNELTNGSLAVSDGELFLRTHEHLWCIGSASAKRTAGQ